MGYVRGSEFLFVVAIVRVEPHSGFMSTLVPHSTKPCTPAQPCTDDVPCLEHVVAYSDMLLNKPGARYADPVEGEIDMAGPESTHPSGKCPELGCPQPCGKCARRVATEGQRLTPEQEVILACLDQPRKYVTLVGKTGYSHKRIERLVAELIGLGRVRLSHAMLPGMYWERV